MKRHSALHPNDFGNEAGASSVLAIESVFYARMPSGGDRVTLNFSCGRSLALYPASGDLQPIVSAFGINPQAWLGQRIRATLRAAVENLDRMYIAAEIFKVEPLIDGGQP